MEEKSRLYLICYSLINIYLLRIFTVWNPCCLSTPPSVKAKLKALGKSPALATQKYTERVVRQDNREKNSEGSTFYGHYSNNYYQY